MEMIVCKYVIDSFSGDYANLRRTDKKEAELKLVARALLPIEIVQGSQLKYELCEYEIIG